ncbi:GFA family protein [Parahaliea mediterranea]|uniref:GFA family protein n=1 Tax=Parahaliea mediterranea TaxID=651086 RepID=A0A939IPB6_9GAMM|nr:GFA family protein [Parahaliea mediterranea]MBN7798993.1 GFA family protein [Parahaliea mediterranea]
MTSRTHGSCLCGNVRFAVEGEFEHFFLCHCGHCRKDTGSAHGANLFSSGATLTWLSGEEQVRSYTLPSTRHARSFCSNCGSALPNVQMDGKLLVVPAGSLDEALPVTPDAHIFCANRADWDRDLQNIPSLDGPPG